MQNILTTMRDLANVVSYVPLDGTTMGDNIGVNYAVAHQPYTCYIFE